MYGIVIIDLSAI